ncbi:ferrous iron transport protein B [Candidatus Poribacteria bacterium]|jgi:ferrous iron transport protein B|nr:ferrous iron transport protein B [Candidatus Poribacteria bacterium]MBT5712473.1 ferrous iron transport protein B [Candidatus Poribacteria bacterium]
MLTRAAPTHAAGPKRVVALAGNPNSGKTTLFNGLTGLRQKVGNYPGVTVERKVGSLVVDGAQWDVLDLPGAYSLTARSPDEAIARDILLGDMDDTPRPDLVVVVVDASNLNRNLYIATQVLDTGVPAIVALNMMDVVEAAGDEIDVEALSERLGAPVVATVANRRSGIEDLATALADHTGQAEGRARWTMPDTARTHVADVAEALRAAGVVDPGACDGEAVRLIGIDGSEERVDRHGGVELATAVQAARRGLSDAGIDPTTLEAEARYRWIRAVTTATTQIHQERTTSRSDRIDRVLTHRVLGPATFLVLMVLVFEAIFAWAGIPMAWIDAAVSAAADGVAGVLPAGALTSLFTDGIISGVGSVIIFLPQILLLFFFIGMLEDTGYMARVAFMMDQTMRRVGLHGRAFIPLLSSFACAIPGIMATRTIESPKDRLVTTLVAPLMTCSARLPVYTLLIAAFLPGGAQAKALAMTGLYVLGVASAIVVAFVLKRTMLKSETPALILELPPYKRPNVRSVVLNMWDRARMFLQRAGTVILSVSVVLWFLSYYPSLPASQVTAFEAQRAGASEVSLAAISAAESAARTRASFAGRLGRFIEPAVRPLGYDWRIGIGLLSSFAAREVFVGAMGTVYSVGDADEQSESLHSRLREARWDDGPKAGQLIYTLPTVIGLLVFYVFALQCVSTIAVIWRETNSWRWPAFAWAYMAALAYAGAWVARTITAWIV